MKTAKRSTAACAPAALGAALDGTAQLCDGFLHALQDLVRRCLGREARGARDDVLARVKQRADVQRGVNKLQRKPHSIRHYPDNHWHVCLMPQ